MSFASYFASVVRDLTWRSQHPHKRLLAIDDPLPERIARITTAYQRSHYDDPELLGRTIADRLGDCHAAIHSLAVDLAIENGQVFELPPFPVHSLSREETVELLDILDDIELRLRHADTLREQFLTAIERLRDAYAPLLPDHQSSLTMPLITPPLVAATMLLFTQELMPSDSIKAHALRKTRERLFYNMLDISQLTLEQYHKTPHKIVSPADHDGDLLDYVAGTALAPFLETPVPFTIPRQLWREHGAMFAPSGHGKTQALQALILDFLDSDTPSLFILDSHGDMLRLIRALDPPGLVVIDPEARVPPALNFLDFRGNPADVAELFSYLMSALSADLSSTQSTMAAFILRLMRAIPGSTIDTLRKVMEDPAKTLEKSAFAPYIATLDPIAQDYFRNQFYASGTIGVTKSSVARRIYTLLSNETFAKMFSAPTNSFDAFAAMQEKRIVLINTSMQLLRAEASSVFGRYMLAQILSAAYQRVNVAPHDRHLALVIVDEAAPYMDHTVERILTETRKFGVGLLLATQFLEQLPANVKAAINGNTAIKLAGPVGHSDATALGREMFTSGDFIRSMRRVEKQYTELACHIRNVTPTAVRVAVPFFLLEDAVGNMPETFDDGMQHSTHEPIVDPEISAEAQRPDESVEPNIETSPTSPTSDDDPATPSTW